MGTVLSLSPELMDSIAVCEEGKPCTPWQEFLSPLTVPENTVHKVYNKKKRLGLWSIKSSSIYKSQGGESSSGNCGGAAGELGTNKAGTAIPRIFWAALPCFPSQSSFGNTFREVFLEGCTFSKAGPFNVRGCSPQTTHHRCKPSLQALLGLHIP